MAAFSLQCLHGSSVGVLGGNREVAGVERLCPEFVGLCRDRKSEKWVLREGASLRIIFLAVYAATQYGALAQLGERMAGSHEVRGSIPLCSTIEVEAVSLGWRPFSFGRRGIEPREGSTAQRAVE